MKIRILYTSCGLKENVIEYESKATLAEEVMDLMKNGFWLNDQKSDWLSPSAILRVWRV